MIPPEDNLPLLTASIVVYNSDLELLRKTLESLDRATASLPDRPTVTLVDNASGPAYHRELKALLAEGEWGISIDLLETSENLGYGGGHNRALAATGQYHLVLNPDVELASDALSSGLARMTCGDDVVLLSPYATGPDGEQEFLCKRHPSVWVLLLRAFAPGLGWRINPVGMANYQMSDVCGPDEEVEAELASGCCMLMRGDLLREVGGFDERYFLYFEDFDLSRRMADHGKVLYTPIMRIVHHGGYAGSKGLRHVLMFMRNGARFFSQYGWRWF